MTNQYQPLNILILEEAESLIKNLIKSYFLNPNGVDNNGFLYINKKEGLEKKI